MDITVLDTNFNPVAIVDTYESFIWTDRYYKYGDFELYTAVDSQIVDIMQLDRYLKIDGSEHMMIIEKDLIESDPEEGNRITVSGRSLESILDRRIVWGQRILDGNLQSAIKTLITEAIINPSISDRKISNFIFEDSTDPVVTNLTIRAQYTGDNLYDVIQAICEDANLGFKVTLNDSNQFVFKLYAGTDRSYNQSTVPFVIFSDRFDNLINSNFVKNRAPLKNVTLIGGEGEGSERRYTTVGSASGLSRRELFTDARDISSKTDDATLSDAEYNAQLQQRGREKLTENVEIVYMDGEVDTSMYQYGVDYFNGDIVQLRDAYGNENSARILEMITSEDKDKISVYPTFEKAEGS